MKINKYSFVESLSVAAELQQMELSALFITLPCIMFFPHMKFHVTSYYRTGVITIWKACNGRTDGKTDGQWRSES